jgi:hypothetical protein
MRSEYCMSCCRTVFNVTTHTSHANRIIGNYSYCRKSGWRRLATLAHFIEWHSHIRGMAIAQRRRLYSFAR